MFNPVVNPFSKYADKTEKKVDRLLNGTAIKSGIEIRQKLLKLMQENLVVVNLWLERRFKGYRYLKKSKRKLFYRNTEQIVAEFNNFRKTFRCDEKALLAELSTHGFTAQTGDRKSRIKYIYEIMNFLKPGKYYQYLEGASFGKLLADITKEKMIGDCNQITTFYMFLYSLNYPIADLKIKLLPGHVCLHYEGIDIEATAGIFKQYDKYDKLLPAVEIITTNLLDTCDFRDKTLQIDARSYIKAAELAYRISESNETVNNNLQVAYRNLAVESAKKYDFDTAKFFASKLDDQEIMRNIMEQEGWYYYKNNNFDQALKIFQSIPDPKMVKACYGEKYNEIQRKVADINTVEKHKAHMADYRKMIELAGKMKDYDLQAKLKKFVDSLK
ncbi:hypothetical protein KJ951_02260 [Patescibacteria group bacterium]|nr:hypothetical protein [Patescibacteria group bacterium]MBU1703204.1 hypothetical protein [Patescibacteria group bacterium]MBU1954369.1 hypothetical protein [Patescibacteria group bacterium]